MLRWLPPIAVSAFECKKGIQLLNNWGCFLPPQTLKNHTEISNQWPWILSKLPPRGDWCTYNSLGYLNGWVLYHVFLQENMKLKQFSSNADMDMATGGRMHPHLHPESKKQMDAGGFVDTQTETSGLALKHNEWPSINDFAILNNFHLKMIDLP